MANVPLIAPVSGVAASGAGASSDGRPAPSQSGSGFHQTLAHVAQHHRWPAIARPVQQAVARVVIPTHRSATPNSTAAIPAATDAALNHAMSLEAVPPSWQDGLRFIMAQESGGRVGAQNPIHSARGLFQLTRVHYHLNPNGEQSFGNAVEEAQGGIRYIKQRYGTADNAVAFWQQHHWY
jgi:Transglycosylase SLT domain